MIVGAFQDEKRTYKRKLWNITDKPEVIKVKGKKNKHGSVLWKASMSLNSCKNASQ